MRKNSEKKKEDSSKKKIEKINRRVRLIEGFLKWWHANYWKLFLEITVKKKRKGEKLKENSR